MSDIFFQELNIPIPDYNLGVGSGTHAEQTGGMLVGIEKILLDNRPDVVLIYGDTNSTLSGALAASKLNIPIAHVEAGLRSFDRAMPEEINRIVADHLSDLLFCPTSVSSGNLTREGIEAGVFVTGDVMVDTLYYALGQEILTQTPVDDLGQKPGEYLIATIHRASNTDDLHNLSAILKAFSDSPYTVVFPLHPRTRKIIQDNNLDQYTGKNIIVTDPLPYTTMLSLISNSRAVLTDSGGIQKEAYILKKPCITIRDNTEWIETVQDGWNILTGADYHRIHQALRDLDHRTPCAHSEVYGDGHAAERIVALLEDAFDR